VIALDARFASFEIASGIGCRLVACREVVFAAEFLPQLLLLWHLLLAWVAE